MSTTSVKIGVDSDTCYRLSILCIFGFPQFSMLNRIIKNSIILSIGILLGRLSGFIRELVIAKKFGISEHADHIVLMLSVPDLLNNLLAAGAVSGVLIPALAIHREKIAVVINEFTKKLFVITLSAYVLLGLGLFWGYESYIFGMLMLALLSAFPNVITFISASYLQYEKRFSKQSLSTLIFNLVVILCLLLGASDYYFATAILTAGIVRMFWVKSDLKHTKFASNFLFFKKINSKIWTQSTENKFVSYQLLVTMMLANGLLFIQPIIDKIFASFLYAGATATLSYAEKIYLLPVSVFLTTYAVALFPDVSRLIADNKHREANNILKKSIPINLIISMMVAVFMWIFNKNIVSLLFGFVGFSGANVLAVSEVLVAYLPIVVVAGSSSILLNMLFAYKAYRLIIIFSGVIIFAKIATNTIILALGVSVFYIALSSAVLSIISMVILKIFYLITLQARIEK